MMHSLGSSPLGDAGEVPVAGALPTSDPRSTMDDPLVSEILGSLATFGRGISQLLAQWSSADIAGSQQPLQAYATTRAIRLFEDFCLAPSLAKVSLARLQLPLLFEVAPNAFARGCEGKDETATPLLFSPSNPRAFSAEFQKLQGQLLHLVSRASAESQLELQVAPTRVRRCPLHSKAAQEGRRQLHSETSVDRQEAQRQCLKALTRVFHLCCRLRCSSILYSCFLILTSCNSGRRDDPFLRTLASIWLLCDEADSILMTVDPSDPNQWQAPMKSPSGDFAAAERASSLNREPSEVSCEGGELNGVLPADGSAYRGGKHKGGGHTLRRLLSGASLARGPPRNSSSGVKDVLEASVGLPEVGNCSLLAVSRCQCVAYVRGFVASLLPALLWSYLTRSLLPPHSQPLPHLLCFLLEEAERGDLEGVLEKGALPSQFLPRLKSRLLQQEGKDEGSVLDNISGLEDLLLLFAGSAEGVSARKKEKRSFGATVAASAMLPQSLQLDGPTDGENIETNSFLQVLGTFSGGNRCTSILAAQQQRSLQMRAMLGHSTLKKSPPHSRYLEEAGTQLVASSEEEAGASHNCREHLLLQRRAPPQAAFMTTEGIQELSLRILACFSCYANACSALEGSVATTASSVEGSFSPEGGLLRKTRGTVLAAGWAQCALWAQQQLLVGVDDHTALLTAGLTEAMVAPQGFVPLSFGYLIPQELLQLSQQQLRAHTASGRVDVVDALATQLVDGALLPLDCSCGGTLSGEELTCGDHCLNAAAESRASIELLLHLEVDPSKTGRACLAVGEPLMLQVCKTLGALLHSTKADGSIRVPSWSIPLGGVECPANAAPQTEEQWLEQLQKAVSHVANVEEQVQKYLGQAQAATADGGDCNASEQRTDKQHPAAYGREPFSQEAFHHQLHLMLMLHQAQHFGCSCCCCTSTDTLECSTLGCLVDLGAVSCRMTWNETHGWRPPASTTATQLWPFVRQELLVRRLHSAARSCMLKAERDWLPQSYWAFAALGTII